jgi:hypothetical protein
MVKMCAYCGVRPASDDEHVVARAFYVNVPKHAATVPSCSDCNQRRGDGGPRNLPLDEEYVRNVLCMSEGGQRHPVAEELFNGTVLRSFKNSPKLTASVLRASRFTELGTEEGVFEPYSSPIFYPEVPRLQRVLRKITKGLYYWIAQKRLPDDYSILANPMVRPDELPAIEDRLEALGILGPALEDEYGVFRFTVAMKKGEIARSHWLMQFYDWAVFHTWTLPKAEVAPGDTGMPPVLALEVFR